MFNYAQIRNFDVANGPGIRCSLFVSGCTHNCPGCFNKEYQRFSYGKKFDHQAYETLKEYLSNPHIVGLTLLGGEPMQNAKGLYEVIKQLKKDGFNKNIWIFSGYQYEDIIKDDEKMKLLKECNVLVDGLFIEALKDLSLRFKGSSNQRTIDIQETLKSGEIKLVY